jgi:serine/threonine-protein phosphatase 2A regulatory subunit A
VLAIAPSSPPHTQRLLRAPQDTASKTSLVARALGPAKASSQLIPCIDEEIDKCPDDELLACLAAELGQLRDLVAGKSDLLPTLEKLCKADETLVRQAAVESLRHIGSTMSADEINGSMVPLVQRLLGEAWWTSKVSAAGLLATAYPLAAPETQAALKGSLPAITKDETPMVRRAVATNLGSLCAVLEPDCVLRELFPSFNKLANDDQDSVRILAYGSCVQMCSTQPAAQCAEFIHPAIENFSKDKSWRVRLEVAKGLASLVAAIPGDLPTTICCNLLQDPELDVRRFALEKVEDVLKPNPDVAESSGILGAVADLADVDMEVPNALLIKMTLARVTLKLSTIVGPALTTSQLVPIVVKLIQEDAMEIRIAVLEGWTDMVKSAGGDLMLSAMPLEVLAEDQSWRVRRSFLEGVPFLAETANRDEFNSSVLPLLTNAAEADEVGSVREAAFQVLADLVPILGDDFAKGTSLPTITSLAGNATFGMRISACQVRACFAFVAPADWCDFCSSSDIQRTVLVVVEIAGDQNVRGGRCRVYRLGADRAGNEALRRQGPERPLQRCVGGWGAGGSASLRHCASEGRVDGA